MYIDLALEELAANAPHTTRDTYMKWLNDHTIMRCIMRAAMSDEFSYKFEDTQSLEMI